MPTNRPWEGRLCSRERCGDFAPISKARDSCSVGEPVYRLLCSHPEFGRVPTLRFPIQGLSTLRQPPQTINSIHQNLQRIPLDHDARVRFPASQFVGNPLFLREAARFAWPSLKVVIRTAAPRLDPPSSPDAQGYRLRQCSPRTGQTQRTLELRDRWV